MYNRRCKNYSLTTGFCPLRADQYKGRFLYCWNWQLIAAGTDAGTAMPAAATGLL